MTAYMTDDSLKILEERIGYRFTDRYLLECALTHTSFANEQKIQTYKDYERIEFLGDAVLEMISSEFLFRTYPEKKEGELTKLRASLVCEPALAYCARDLSLGAFIRLGRGEEASGGRNKASILADAFEALVGAIIIDGGYEAGRDIILRLLEERIRLGAQGKLNKDFKTKLQEKLQEADHNVRIEYRKVAESGPDHNKTFTIEVEINGKTAGTGVGQSKAKAEQAAAEDALSKGV
jgi:ribonuclease-3